MDSTHYSVSGCVGSLFSGSGRNRTRTHSCKSGRAFWVGFRPKVDKNFGLNSGLRRTICLRCTKI